MDPGKRLGALLLAAVIVAATPSLARAQDRTFELGSTLVNTLVSLEDENFTIIGIPSGGLGILNPGLYGSFFIGQHVAVEPQVGLIVSAGGGNSEHLLNFVGQVDYFVQGLEEPSPYVFLAAGVLEFSGSGPSPKSIGGGGGYRFPVGDRLVFRVDGRVTHYTEEGGNILSINLSIGGVIR